jgi:hypothetical protein
MLNIVTRRRQRSLLAAAFVQVLLAAFGYVAVGYVAAERFTTDYPHTRVDRAPAVEARTYEDVAFRTVESNWRVHRPGAARVRGAGGSDAEGGHQIRTNRARLGQRR